MADTRYRGGLRRPADPIGGLVQALSDRQGPKYPLFGWAYGISETCGFWSDPPRQPLPTLPPSVAKNVLVVQGEFDPQTGYDQAHAAVAAARASPWSRWTTRRSTASTR